MNALKQFDEVSTCSSLSNSSQIIEPHHEKTGFFSYAKTKAQISFAVTVKLISPYVELPDSTISLLPKSEFQASSHLLYMHRPVCVRPGRKPPKTAFLTLWLIW